MDFVVDGYNYVVLTAYYIAKCKNNWIWWLDIYHFHEIGDFIIGSHKFWIIMPKMYELKVGLFLLICTMFKHTDVMRKHFFCCNCASVFFLINKIYFYWIEHKVVKVCKYIGIQSINSSGVNPHIITYMVVSDCIANSSAQVG